jgi:hypothetical protein
MAMLSSLEPMCLHTRKPGHSGSPVSQLSGSMTPECSGVSYCCVRERGRLGRCDDFDISEGSEHPDCMSFRELLQCPSDRITKTATQRLRSAEKFLRSRRNNLDFVREDRSSGGHHRRPDCITGNTLRYRVDSLRLHNRHAASSHGQAVFASRASAVAAALPTGFFSAALAIPNETAFPTAFSVTPFFTALLTAFSTFFAAFFLALSFAISKYLGVQLVSQLEIVQGRRFFDVSPAAAEAAQ